MRTEAILAIAGSIVVAITLFGVLWRRRPRRLKTAYFVKKWRELQEYCSSKETWPEAIKAADKLLEEALKKRRFHGKSMGEKLVAAQRTLTDNDAVWTAHNLCKKLKAEPNMKLRENQVKKTLISFRQALKDLEAL